MCVIKFLAFLHISIFVDLLQYMYYVGIFSRGRHFHTISVINNFIAKTNFLAKKTM
jgi:hypothetical protein